MKRVILILVSLILLAIITPAQAQDTAYFWAGGYFDESSTWHDTIYVAGGQWLEIPIYFYSGPDIWAYEIQFPLGVRHDACDSIDVVNYYGYQFWPFITWWSSGFYNYNDDILDEGENYANPSGYHSLSFYSWHWSPGADLLHAEDIIQILYFRFKTSNNNSLSGTTSSLEIGYDPSLGPEIRLNNNVGSPFPVRAYFAKIHFANGFICGTVTDGYGTPIQDAWVEIIDSTFHEYASSDGGFCLASLPNGTYDIAVSHPDYCDKVITNVTVVEGDTTTLDIVLNNGIITGTVMDGAANPLPGIYANIAGTEFEDTTDTDGQYYFQGLCPGSYDLSFISEDYCDKYVYGVQVSVDDTVTLDIVLGNSIINGTVTDATMNPLPEVYVQIENTDFIDTTDLAGQYSFRSLCSGSYNLIFTNPGYCRQILEDVTIGTDDTLQVDLVMVSNSAISGTIYDAEHVPLPGVIVEAIDLVFADTSEIDGHYQLDGLCAATYDLLLTLPGYCDSSIYSISIGENSTYTLNVEFDNGGVLTGNIIDPDSLPLSGVVVSVSGTVATGTTGPDGNYTIIGICPGEYDITFAKEDYWQVPAEDIAISHNYSTVLNVFMCPALPDIPDTVEIWAGGNFDNCEWYDTIAVQPGQWLDIPIYFRGGSNVWSPSLCLPLGARRDIIDQFDSSGCSSDYWPFNQVIGVWYNRFGFYNDETDPTNPDPAGYHSLSFNGTILNSPHIYLHSETPIKILNFRVHVSDSMNVEEQIIDSAFISGIDPIQGPPYVALDSLVLYGDAVLIAHYPVLKITAARSAYLLGDVNMYNGSWPPAVIGSDVTYLVNYFRGISTSHPCLLDGFWGSADVNGDCHVIGSDVTRLVGYFRGQGVLQTCPDHLPLWENSQDLPQEAPPDWPGCE